MLRGAVRVLSMLPTTLGNVDTLDACAMLGSMIQDEVAIPSVPQSAAAFLADPSRWATTTDEVIESSGMGRSRAASMAVASALRAAGFTTKRRASLRGARVWLYVNPSRQPST